MQAMFRDFIPLVKTIVNIQIWMLEYMQDY
jgi:hypothetical protein